jgi:hypothetical protein
LTIRKQKREREREREIERDSNVGLGNKYNPTVLCLLGSASRTSRSPHLLAAKSSVESTATVTDDEPKQQQQQQRPAMSKSGRVVAAHCHNCRRFQQQQRNICNPTLGSGMGAIGHSRMGSSHQTKERLGRGLATSLSIARDARGHCHSTRLLRLHQCHSKRIVVVVVVTRNARCLSLHARSVRDHVHGATVDDSTIRRLCHGARVESILSTKSRRRPAGPVGGL